jgi:hypothetical protein
MTDGEFFVKEYANDPVKYCVEVLGYEPDTWQAEDLAATVQHQRIAVASGHGVGKTRLVASKIHWFLSTRPIPQVVVTANTQTQLATKTWRELAKVNDSARNKDWFDKSAQKFWLKDSPETWFASAIPWTENRSEAFAGTHEEHVLYLFDEASAIADIIWEVSEGAMTTAGAKFCVYGNPTKNTGRFSECFGRFKHRWHTMQIDSRTAKMADKKQIQEWVDDYGEDSDFVRVRVRGVFPRAGSSQFIDSDSVEKCRQYHAEGYESHAVVFGVDIARFGDDQNAVAIRQGRKVEPLVKWRGIDTMQTASRVVDLYEAIKPDMIFVDGGGVGGGVIDRLRQLLPKEKVTEVNFGSTSFKPKKYFNKRAEIWGEMKDALVAGIEIPDDNELIRELTSVEYGFSVEQKIQLEHKADMKRRGLSSPDCADALALTYAATVIKNREAPKGKQNPYASIQTGSDGWMN